MHNKLGFWSLFALVISSQIGSGIFILPVSLAPYGAYSLVSWAMSGLGAISLAIVFASLCAKIPGSGGPHVYVQYAFGSTAAFFVGWTYWVISWVGTTAVIVESIGYLVPLFHNGICSNMRLFLEICLLLFITLINLRSITTVGRIEFILTLIKVLVLIIIPITALLFFDYNNFIISEEISNLTASQILARSTLLTLWCFIGLELVTTTSGAIENSTKIIPKAIVSGTVCVAIVYFINHLAIAGLMNGSDLINSKSPYADAMKIILPGDWYLIISIIAFIFCSSSLIAWILATGRVAFGLASDNLMPQFFSKVNKHNSPIYGIVTGSLGTLVLLILTSSNNFVQQITFVISITVISYLFIYFVCCISFLKYVMQAKMLNYIQISIGMIATIFCVWVIWETPVNILLTATIFTVSGLPVFYLVRFKDRISA